MSDVPTPLERDLADVRCRMQGQSRPNQVIAEMFAYSTDLRRQSLIFGKAKTDAERALSRAVVTRKIADPKEPVSLSEHYALKDDDSIYNARVAYRLAESLMSADREALKVLHAELDKLRTEAADRRAADSFTAREAS